MIEVKKYSNRKLYLVKESRYTTLKELAELLRQGKRIQVVDNRTSENITSDVLQKVLIHANIEDNKIYELIRA